MLALAFAAAALQPALNPQATALFERDPTIAAWALKRFDKNGDGWLTQYEAATALAAFKQIADTNGDERVTVEEFQRAKAYVEARDNLPVVVAAP